MIDKKFKFISVDDHVRAVNCMLVDGYCEFAEVSYINDSNVTQEDRKFYYGRALKILEDILENKKKRPESIIIELELWSIHNQIADLYGKIGETEKAIGKLRLAEKVDPWWMALGFFRYKKTANLYFQESMYNKAIEFYELGIRNKKRMFRSLQRIHKT